MIAARQQFDSQAKPPSSVTLLSALQHLAIIAPIGLVFPLLVGQRANASDGAIDTMLATSMLVLGVATFLQCARFRGLGSGFFAPAIFTAAYLPPSLAAAEQGGLPLVFGMTIFAGVCEMIMSRALGRLRPYLPTEVAGLAVAMIGIILGLLGFRLLAGIPSAGTAAASGAGGGSGIGAFALAAIIVVNIWGPRSLRIYAVLIALIAAWIVAAFSGGIDFGRLRAGFDSGMLWFPRWSLAVPDFEPRLALDFAVGALACALRAVGDITTCQKIDNPEWLRPDMASLKNGVLADGLGTAAAGLLGTVGLNTFSGSIGLSAATGVRARRIGFALGGIFILLAFVPGAIALVRSIPLPVTGAMLLFAASFILLNGLQVILSRLLDNRKVLVVGLGLLAGLSHDVFPEFFRRLPAAWGHLVGSPLVAALLVAILLNLLFRIGVAARAQLVLAPGREAIDRVHEFCQAQGAAWAARRDVMHRVTTALVEFAETSGELVAAGNSATIDLAFDEFHIDAVIRYAGRTAGVPSAAEGAAVELLETDELPPHLPLLIIGRMADKSSSGEDRHGQWLRLTFEH